MGKFTTIMLVAIVAICTTSIAFAQGTEKKASKTKPSGKTKTTNTEETKTDKKSNKQ